MTFYIRDLNDNRSGQPQVHSFIGKTWDRAKWVVGNASRPVAWAFSPVGDGLGSGFMNGANRELEQMLKTDGPLASQLREFVAHALLKQPPPELFQLKELIKKALEDTHHLTSDDVRSIDAHLQLLFQEQSKLLKLLAPNMSPEAMGLFEKVAKLFNTPHLEEGGLDFLKQNLADASKQDIQNFNAVFNTILDENQGALIQAISFLQQALLQTKQYFSDSLNDEENGILVQAMDLFNQKLHEKDGPIDLLDIRLTDKDTGIFSRAADILQEKLMPLIDQFDERLTGQAHPLLLDSRKKLIALRRAIIAQDKASIQKSSRELQGSLEQLTIQTALVFSKKPLGQEDQLILNQLKTQLPNFYGDTPPDQVNMLIPVEAAFAVINRYYGSCEGVAARIATILQEALSDSIATVVETINPLLTRFENMPKTMAQNLLGGMPEGTTAENGGLVSQFLDTGGSILQKMLEKGAQAVCKQSLPAFGRVLAFGIRQALDHMDDTPASRQPRAVLTGIIDNLNATRENGNWSGLYQNLLAAAEALKLVKIHVNGFHVPNIGSGEAVGNAEGVYSNNMNTLQKAIDDTPSEPEGQDWKALAKAEKDKFIGNLTKFLTMKHIYEDVCRLKPTDERFYMRLLSTSKEKGDQADSELKKLFFEELEKSNIGFVKKLYAKVQYLFYNSIVKHYIAKASNIYFDEIFNYIQQHSLNNFDTLRNQVTTNFVRYLTILGGAYENVAENPHSTGTLDEMLQKELEKKESNLGFEKQDLYLKFAHIVVQKTLGSGLLGWIGKKFISRPEEIVRFIIDKSVGSIQDVHGYSPALNRIVCEQLKEVWKLFQAQYAHQQDNPIEIPELSDAKKNELHGLVKNLFEILRKSKCQTKDELRNLIKGKLWSAKVNQAIDDLFLEEIIEKVSNIFALGIQSLVKEDQLQKLAYRFTYLVNSTFSEEPSLSPIQAQEDEREIAQLSSQILREAVNIAVEEQFDLTGKKQQQEANSFISNLHNLSSQFFTTTDQDLAALANMDFSSPEGKNKINKITEEVLAYESKCYESITQAKSSKINTDNRDEISKRYLGIAQQSQPLVQATAQLKQHAKTLETIRIVAPRLSEIKTIASAIPLRLFHPRVPTDEDLAFCETQLAILDTHLKELKKMRQFAAIAEQIETQTRIFATIFIDLRKAIKTNLFCTAQAQPNSLLEQIASEKKQSLESTTENISFKNKLTTLEQEMSQTCDDVYRPQLLTQLRHMEQATLAQQVDTAKQEFIRICQQAMAQANASRDIQRGSYHRTYQNVVCTLDGTHLLEPNHDATVRGRIRESIALAQQHLQTLAAWEQEHVQLIPYANFSVVDLKELQDWASGLVYDRVRERSDGFISLLSREETYRYGLLHHLFLLPYVQATQAPNK